MLSGPRKGPPHTHQVLRKPPASRGPDHFWMQLRGSWQRETLAGFRVGFGSPAQPFPSLPSPTDFQPRLICSQQCPSRPNNELPVQRGPGTRRNPRGRRLGAAGGGRASRPVDPQAMSRAQPPGTGALEARGPHPTPCPHLDAVVGGVGGADQVLVGPAVQVRIFPTDEPVTRVARPALALEHGVAEVAQVDTLSMPVAVVGLVLAGVFRLTHLRGAGCTTAEPEPDREGRVRGRTLGQVQGTGPPLKGCRGRGGGVYSLRSTCPEIQGSAPWMWPEALTLRPAKVTAEPTATPRVTKDHRSPPWSSGTLCVKLRPRPALPPPWA